MKKRYGISTILIAIVISTLPIVQADDTHDHTAPIKMSKGFEQIKSLVGRWEGTSKEGKEESPVAVDYRLTSGGTALVETLSPGTPHEMVSVYADQGGKLVMTHFCMLGNQPQMELKKADANAMNFELMTGGAIDPQKEAHMHGLSIIFADPDVITERWTFYEKGRETKSTVFKLARVK